MALKNEGLTSKIIGVYYDDNELGHGFLESVYEKAMAVALKQAGFAVENQAAIPATFRGLPVGDFRADIIVNGTVLVELKCARTLCVNPWQEGL